MYSSEVKTCDLLYPQWVRPDPSCLVLEPGHTKASSIQIDPAYLKVGPNSGQITITNSDIKINVSVDVTANGPVPQLKTTYLYIFLTIKQTLIISILSRLLMLEMVNCVSLCQLI